MKRLVAVLAVLLAAPVLAVGVAEGVAPKTSEMTFETPPESPLEFRGALSVTPPNSDFGGLSGVVMLGQGKALAITDRANWVHLDLEIDAGRLTGVNQIRMEPMVDGAGRPLQGGGIDSEDLTRDPETGALWVSFEADHRIWRMDAPGGKPVASVRHPSWEGFSVNTGLEGLARDRKGRLWSIKEGSGDISRPFPVYVYDGSGWEVKSLPRLSDHHVTGADFGPDGWMYITERDFSFTSGFDFRLRRVKWSDGPVPVADEVLIELAASTRIDNIEGVSVWRERGETLILLVSDDNMFWLQRNVIALFALKHS